eukprot:XP_001697292.1 predicted protein [Chlamydomonas reinhardtii]
MKGRRRRATHVGRPAAGHPLALFWQPHVGGPGAAQSHAQPESQHAAGAAAGMKEAVVNRFAAEAVLKACCVIREITSLAADLGVTPWLEAYKHDATQAVAGQEEAVAGGQEKAVAADEGPEAAVLLDPPCSALGLRPRLMHSWSLAQLRALAAYQRSLLVTAVAALAPGGTLLYCTCTISPQENEANVAWALDRYAGALQLEPAAPLLGLPGLTGADPHTGERWLSPKEADMVGPAF